jgi:hypothetical protein
MIGQGIGPGIDGHNGGLRNYSTVHAWRWNMLLYCKMLAILKKDFVRPHHLGQHHLGQHHMGQHHIGQRYLGQRYLG